MRLLLKYCLIVGGFLLMTTGAFAQGAAPTSRAERAELRFLEGMMDHHQMALDMANDCLQKAQKEALRRLCQSIIDAQTAEIAQMQGWLNDWYSIEYAPMPMDTNSMPGMSMPDPMMMMGMMAGLNQLEGREYEIAWIESMIDHHDDALHMSERLLQQVVHDELRTMANAIISDQTAEIETMEAMLVTLSA